MGFPAHSVVQTGYTTLLVQTGYTTPTLRFSGYTTRGCATHSVYISTKPPRGCNVTYIYYSSYKIRKFS